MKVIFLDIDGVLNHRDTKDRIGGYIGLNPGMIKRFNRIIAAHPDVKIVVSSTWRHSFSHGVYENFGQLVELLKSRGVEGEIIGHTPFPPDEPPSGGWMALGATAHLTRGAEIRLYLKDHPEVTNYIVLDDDEGGMKPKTEPFYDRETDNYYNAPAEIDLRPRWVQTSWANGLKERSADKAIRLLEKP